ncbi:SURF1 family protein [Oleiagrimonas sp. C23AA]|uniref:SURF1 family protein n=1 Tax=Oleiagrimonas sp. C23AA TaxID=2719047 RepID=UPI001981A2F8|nr:SURF1 family protein [Oleiagrimonas sp. C23AA]
MRLRRPSVFAVLLTLAGVVLFIRLGIWQLNRAVEKEQLLRRFATANSAPTVPFSKVAAGAPAHAYPHVSVAGHFLRHHLYVMDDQVLGDRVGVQVYAPFVVSGGQRVVLVGLGFLPRGGSGKTLPYIPPLPDHRMTLHGLYVPPPAPALRMGGNRLPDQKQWPKTMIYMDLGDISKDLGHPLYPRRLLLDPDPAQPYVRKWTPGVMPPARHRGYAFQWFSFAAAAVAIFVILHRRRDPKDASKS